LSCPSLFVFLLPDTAAFLPLAEAISFPDTWPRFCWSWHIAQSSAFPGRVFGSFVVPPLRFSSDRLLHSCVLSTIAGRRPPVPCVLFPPLHSLGRVPSTVFLSFLTGAWRRLLWFLTVLGFCRLTFRFCFILEAFFSRLGDCRLPPTLHAPQTPGFRFARILF